MTRQVLTVSLSASMHASRYRRKIENKWMLCFGYLNNRRRYICHTGIGLVHCCSQKTREENRGSLAHLLTSSLIPMAYIVYLSTTTDASAAAGLSSSQQKAYDAFVQYGIPSSSTSGKSLPNGQGRKNGMEVRVSRTQQQQQAEKSRIKTALDIFARAEENQKAGNYGDALKGYEHVIEKYSDLALAERARIKRALMEYQVGKVRECILHLEDEEVAVRGNAEVHAALAAVLYSERPNELSLAEEQWDVATEFDTRYSSIEFVQNNRYWPPAMVSALKNFLLLQHS